jgi:hypothetical protein
MRELHVELLVGRKVRDPNDDIVGRIEEIRCERRDEDCLVEAYYVGTSGLIQRLNAWKLVRPIRHVLKGSRFYHLYEIPWNQLDLSDPEKPRTTVPRAELSHAR